MEMISSITSFVKETYFQKFQGLIKFLTWETKLLCQKIGLQSLITIQGRSWRGVWFWRENVTKTLFTGVVSKLQKKFVHVEDVHPRHILESKGYMRLFRKRVKKDQKSGEIFENLDKNVKNLKIFCKKGSFMRAFIACMKQLEYALTLPPFMLKRLKLSSYIWGKHCI